MRTAFPKTLIGLLALVFALCGQNVPGQNSQTQPAPQPADTSQPSTQQPSAKKPSTQQKHPETSPGAEAGKGAGDIGKGTAKGAGAAAKGVGKGAGDLVTLHPLNAAGDVSKGAVGAGKDVGVGAVKGTGKIAKGTGRGIGKIFHHHHETKPDPAPAAPQN